MGMGWTWPWGVSDCATREHDCAVRNRGVNAGAAARKWSLWCYENVRVHNALYTPFVITNSELRVGGGIESMDRVEDERQQEEEQTRSRRAVSRELGSRLKG